MHSAAVVGRYHGRTYCGTAVPSLTLLFDVFAVFFWYREATNTAFIPPVLATESTFYRHEAEGTRGHFCSHRHKHIYDLFRPTTYVFIYSHKQRPRHGTTDYSSVHNGRQMSPIFVGHEKKLATFVDDIS